MKRLLEEYEKVLNKRVERGEIKPVTRDTYLNDAERILEALVFSTGESDIQERMRAYALKGNYRTAFRLLRPIIEHLRPKRKS